MHFKCNLLTQIMKYIIPPHNLVEIRIPKKFSVCIFLEDTDRKFLQRRYRQKITSES